eukprot:4016392-Prymnesium_polylepis.1
MQHVSRGARTACAVKPPIDARWAREGVSMGVSRPEPSRKVAIVRYRCLRVVRGVSDVFRKSNYHLPHV